MTRVRLFDLGNPGRTYLGKSLGIGNSLAEALRHRLHASAGVCLTLLPETATQERAFNFEAGGLECPDGLRRALSAPDAARRGLLVMQTILASLANALSCRTDSRLLVAVDANARPRDPVLASSRSGVFHWGDEVFRYVAGSPVPEADALFAIADASAAWSGIVTLSPIPDVGWPPGPDRRLPTAESLVSIATKATLIASAAYDIEGYVFWTPADRYPKLLSVLSGWYDVEQVR